MLIPGRLKIFYDILIPLNDLSIMIKEEYKRDGFRGNVTPLIQQALRLDADLVSWVSSLGPAWQYTVASNSPFFFFFSWRRKRPQPR